MGYGTLDIAKCALFAQQIGMQVTSHNIANVNTPGYSRQRVIFSPYDPIPFPFGQVGRGWGHKGRRSPSGDCTPGCSRWRCYGR
ncbi:MAG: hypothetical protein DRG36_06365 [Deltaproteobacteria bacterium]|nr:MAG: hypothetical protein DRG36_06365 [Deltaproteobacteria bacterium]